MATNTFYSDNTTGTFADALQAVGLAETLSTWLAHLGQRSTPIRISDCGVYYRIELPVALGEEEVNAVTSSLHIGHAKPIITARHKKKAQDAGEEALRKLEQELWGYDYDNEKAKRDDYVARLKKLDAASRARYHKNHKAEEFADIQSRLPDEDLGLYVAINHFKIADTYNKLCHRWVGESLSNFQENLSLLWQTFTSHPNALPARPRHRDSTANSQSCQRQREQCAEGIWVKYRRDR